jgi:uncharacterized NAD(P)/FAD-binding protein YdhS
MARDGCRIAVIGGGFSGVMTAIHLLWRCQPGERVYLVERGDRVGPGLAYGTRHPRHLVNVRAENMSAFADEPDHFVRWLEGLDPAAQADAGERTIAGTFVRRSVFGAYVQDLLREAIARQDGADNLFLVADQAVAVRPAGGRFLLETANGRAHPVDAAVLALGNLPPGVALCLTCSAKSTHVRHARATGQPAMRGADASRMAWRHLALQGRRPCPRIKPAAEEACPCPATSFSSALPSPSRRSRTAPRA